MWAYSKKDTMAHTYRLMVISYLMVQSAYKTFHKELMNINEDGCLPLGMASALMVIGICEIA